MTIHPKQKNIFLETKMTENGSTETIRVKAKNFTTVLLSALKGSKFCIAFLLGIWFAYEVYTAFGKLDNQTTFTSSSTVEVNFTYPSVTICVTMDSNFTGGPMNKDWQPNEKYNLTVPFDHLGYISDRNERTSDFLSPNLNDVDNLKSLGYDVEDIWTYAIRGQMAEPFPCYTYQPKKQRTNGISNHLWFRLKGPNDPKMLYLIAVHNHDAFVPSMAQIFGTGVALLATRKGQFINAMYEVSRSNITELKAFNNCSDDEALLNDTKPGLVMSSEGPKTVDKCIEDYYVRELGCKMPWIVGNESKLETCSTSESYLKYTSLVQELIDDTSKVSFWNLVQCQPRCQYTQFHLHKTSESNFDILDYAGYEDDGANAAAMLYFTSTEIEMKQRIKVYDESNLMADIGGYLGLFLGASIYTLVDVIVSSLEKVVHKK